MGISRSPEELVRKITLAGVAIGDESAAIKETAKAVKTVFVGSLRASGVNGTTKISRGVKARYDIKGTKNPTAIIRYTGAAHLLNNPTRPHYITPKGVRGSRASRQTRAQQARESRDEFSGFGARSPKRGAKAIKIGGEFRAYVHHPGTRGLGFFQRAKPIAQKVAPRVYQRSGVTLPLKKVFG